MQNAVLLAILVGLAFVTPATTQRVQTDFICLEADMEFPVDCGDDED